MAYLVRYEQEHDVRLGGSLCPVCDVPEPVLVGGAGVFVPAVGDDNLRRRCQLLRLEGVAQVLRLGSALVAVSHEQDGLPGQGVERAVLVVEESGRHAVLLARLGVLEGNRARGLLGNGRVRNSDCEILSIGQLRNHAR